MNYKIYPFKRGDKYRFYVRFDDENGNKKNLSTGVTLPLSYTNKQRIEAERKAEKAVKQRVLTYFNMELEIKKNRIDR